MSPNPCKLSTKYWDNAASYNLALHLSSLTHTHTLTQPINFGTQANPISATHVGVDPNLPPAVATTFWGPGFKHSLLSLGYLQRKGGSYATDALRPRTHVLIRAPDGTIIDTPKLSESNLLPANTNRSRTAFNRTPALAQLTSTITAAAAARLDAAEALHLKYNHPSDEILAAAIANKSITTSVTAADIRTNRIARGPCPHCIVGKLRDLPHPASTHPRATKPGQRLFIDIHDLPAPSAGGSTTSIRCVDGFSTRFDVIGSRTKTTRDIFTAILTIIATAYNAFGHIVEVIYTDSEAVFASLQALLGAVGIQLLLANPSDHNRYFERHNQTISNRALATTSALPYHLPPKYELQLTAATAFTFNSLPNSSTGGLTPWQLVTRQPPPTPLSAFGCVHYVTHSTQQRLLLASKTKTPLKSTDKAIIGVNMGKNPLWPSSDQFLLANGIIVSRKPRSLPLQLIPFAFLPKKLDAIPTLPLAPPLAQLPPLPAPPASTAAESPTPANDTPATASPPPTVSTIASAPPPTTALAPPPLAPPSLSNTPVQSPAMQTLLLSLHPNPSQGKGPAPTSRSVDFASPNQFEALTDADDAASPLPPDNPDPSTASATEPLTVVTASAPPAPITLPPPPHNAKATAPATRAPRSMTFSRTGAILSALVVIAAITPPLTAVARKAHHKQAAMSTAKLYLPTITPHGLTNTSATYNFDSFDLNPPDSQPDEMRVDQARRLASLPGACPLLLGKIDAAVEVEMTKVTTKYDTLRLICPANPMDKDAFKIHSLMFIKFKRDGRVTARLAGCGNQQHPSSYSSTYASTSDHNTHTMIVAAYYAHAIATNTVNTLVHSDFDINGAFLQNRLPRSATGGKQLVMKLPTSLPHPWAGRWVEVVGALYGLKQSNAIFEKDFAKVMASINFLPAHESQHGITSAPDSSVYHYTDPHDPSLKCTVPMHVDDGQILSTSTAIVKLLKSTLEARYGTLTWNDTSTQHTGTTMTRYPTGAIAFDMSRHITKTLHTLGMGPIPGALTPCSPDLFTDSVDTTPTDRTKYQRIVGALTYISRNRHDISKNVYAHQTKNQNPTVTDERKAVRTLQYLKSFPDTPAIYYTNEGPTLCAHADASHANQPNGKSTTCITLSIGSLSAPFLCKTFAQDDIALDPCAAEYYSLSPLCQLILRFRHLLAAIGFPQSGPTTIYVDNVPAIDLALSNNMPKKSRYMLAKHHFVRLCAFNSIVRFKQKNTNYHSPDLNTKPHGPTSHHFLTKLMMNLDAPTTI